MPRHGREFHSRAKPGLLVVPHQLLQVRDEDGTLIGEFFADLLVEGELIVELKACKGLTDDHVGQILGYLRAARMRHGLLINFGSPRFEIRKFIW